MRSAKIEGVRYVLRVADISRREVMNQAQAINQGAGPRRVEHYTAHVFNEATGRHEPVARQYTYQWRETDRGAPARVKTASQDQIARWPELQAWRDRSRLEHYREPVLLLWVREDVAAREPSGVEPSGVSAEKGEVVGR